MGLFRKSEPKSKAPVKVGHGNPQEVGVVSGLIRQEPVEGASSPNSNIVERRFGPASQSAKPAKLDALPSVTEIANVKGSGPAAESTSVSAPSGSFAQEKEELEIDPMAIIGKSTTITGDIHADEDVEIHGTVEGTVRLPENRVMIGESGLVKARVESSSVLVLGRIEGDVFAGDVVEVKAGGYIGGNLKAPRVILEDGAIVIGGLDMSAGVADDGPREVAHPTLPPVKKPVLKKVEMPVESADQPVGNLSNEGTPGGN